MAIMNTGQKTNAWQRPLNQQFKPLTPTPTQLGDMKPTSTAPTKLGSMNLTAVKTNYSQPVTSTSTSAPVTTAAQTVTNPKPKGTGNYNVDKEIMRKASNGIALTDPKNQAIYDSYQAYLTNEIKRKAQAGETLDSSTVWKDNIYNTEIRGIEKAKKDQDAQKFFEDYMGQITGSYDKQQQAALERFKMQRDQAIGQINQQKAELTPQYAGLRNQADVVNAQNVAKLREMMASNGLTGSGENVTGSVALGSARQGALNQLNTQEQQQRNDFDRRIADLNNPAELNAMQAALDAEKMRAMADGMRYGDERKYQRERDAVEDGRYDEQWDYQVGRDKVADQRYKDEWDYQKGRDKVADSRYDSEWAYQQKRDQVGDEQWNKQFKSQEEARKAELAWREYTYKNLSAAEKKNFDIMESQFGQEQAWKMYQLNYEGDLQKSLAQSEIDFYKNSGFNSGGGGGGYTKKASGSPNQAYQGHLNAAIAQGKIPKEWAGALTELVGRESSWNPGAKNPNSTAHGYGQFLNSTRSNYEKKMGLDYSNPVHQLIMMAQYVKDRYGTPEKALAFWDKNKWY